MRIDLIDTEIVRGLRRLDDDAAAPPYDWAEFQRRRRARIVAPRGSARTRWVIAAALSALVITALGGYLASMVLRRPTARRADQAALARSSRCAPGGTHSASPGGLECTRALPVNTVRTAPVPDWLAGLPNQPVVLRLGTRVAESGLVNQIAAVDALLSAARVSGAQPVRLAPLVRRRRQLVSALAEVRYAELLAAASQSAVAPGAPGRSR